MIKLLRVCEVVALLEVAPSRQQGPKRLNAGARYGWPIFRVTKSSERQREASTPERLLESLFSTERQVDKIDH
jgi:hypothetical protein